MLLADPTIIKCPSCGTLQEQPTSLSGNLLGVEYYSDGKYETEMLQKIPKFVRCSNIRCKKYFKNNDNVFAGFNHNNEQNIPCIKPLRIYEYQQAIKEGLINGDESDILSLRIELWRAFNDNVRHGEGIIKDKEIEQYDNNCKEILSLLKHKIDNDGTRLLCAELYRNIANFNECKKLLSEIESLDENKEYFNTIDEMCKKQNRYTVSFSKCKG